MIPKFEEETGITVNLIGTYSANDEWWARLNAGETWDFFIPTTDWVERAMKADLLQPLDTGMGVDLRRAEARMTEQLLHRAKIRPCIQQVGGEGVA